MTTKRRSNYRPDRVVLAKALPVVAPHGKTNLKVPALILPVSSLFARAEPNPTDSNRIKPIRTEPRLATSTRIILRTVVYTLQRKKRVGRTEPNRIKPKTDSNLLVSHSERLCVNHTTQQAPWSNRTEPNRTEPNRFEPARIILRTATCLSYDGASDRFEPRLLVSYSE